MSKFLYRVKPEPHSRKVIPFKEKTSFEGESLKALLNRTFRGMGENIICNESELSEVGKTADVEAVDLTDEQNGVIGTVTCVPAEPL